jgi:ABC-type multidrug transport system fused ATPase/permease subunit
MRTIGYIFLSLFISVLIIIGDYFLPGSFLTRFLDNSFIETFAGLVGFNIAAVIFLLGQLIDLEKKMPETDIFQKTRREIKHNSYFLLFAFVASLILLIVRPDLGIDQLFGNNVIYYILNVFILAIFGLAINAIFEILSAVFTLGKSQK